ncbi:MAG: hypothetical protein RIT26_756 [Pseudomonadota bacterium]|jgi:flagellar hook-length control protein FliK
MLNIPTLPTETPSGVGQTGKSNSLELRNEDNALVDGPTFRDVMSQLALTPSGRSKNPQANTETQPESVSDAETTEQRQEMASDTASLFQISTEGANAAMVSTALHTNGAGHMSSFTAHQTPPGPNGEIQPSEQALEQSTGKALFGAPSTASPFGISTVQAASVSTAASLLGHQANSSNEVGPGPENETQNQMDDSAGADHTLASPTAKHMWPADAAWPAPSALNRSDQAQDSASLAPNHWHETRLTHQFTVITGSASTLSEDSLTEFALQQGLDEKTVKWLFLNDAAQVNQTQAKITLNGAGLVGLGAQWLIGEAPGKGPFPWSARAEMDLDLTPGLQSQWNDWFKWNTKLHPSALTSAGSILESGLGSPRLSTLNGSEAADGRTNDASVHAALSSPSHSSPGNLTSKAGDTGFLKELGIQKATPLLGQDLAEKMSLAIGKRILEAFEKGDWQIKIHLRPAELGHVEVDLRMRGNALDAQLSANQSVTRDLLESGLAKLKDSLTQTGMDVASVRVNDGQSSRSGGDSTPRQPQARFAPQGSEDGSSSPTENPAATLRSSNHDGSLDLMA